MKINKIILSLISFALLISSNGYARYKSISLRKMHQHIDILTQDCISFDYKILSKSDCKKYFGSTGVLSKGYRPIQINFTNNSSKSIAISPDSFSFRCAHAQDVANTLHRNGFSRGLGFGLGALFFLPLFIPALTQGCGAKKYNHDMDIDFSNKAFKNQVVPPYSSVDGIIFASQDQFSRNFTITVKDTHEKKSLMLSPNKPQLLL